jgi:hypothetical protein
VIRSTLAALLALPLMAQAGGAMSAVQQQMQVDARGGKVVVTLTLNNGSAKAVHVPRALYEDDQLFRREFAITDLATGAEVGYTGPMVKRGPLTRADFLAVKPGQTRRHSIDITASYDFKAQHKYQLSYDGGVLADPARLDAVTALAPPAVTFSFAAP